MPSISTSNSYITDYPTAPSLHRLTHEFGPSPPQQLPSLQHLGKCHVDSFNFMLTDGLKAAVKDLDPVEFLIPETGSRIAVWISDVTVSRPGVVPGSVGATNKDVYPTEARQRGGSYKGRCTIRAGYSINGITQPMLEKVLGNIPIMLRSMACHLHNLTPAQLVEKGEHEQEWGGYFVIGGAREDS